MQTLHDIREGLGFIGRHPRVRGVIVGMGVGIIGGAAMVPLGPVFSRQALGGDSATFGVLATALGFGAAAGVVILLAVQKRINKETVFEFAVMGTGVFLIVGASFSSLGPSALFIGLTGACAGTSYVTGFTTLQEQVHDELRGRTFASLYTVIRLCMLISLVTAPLWADFWDWFVELFMDSQTISLGDGTYEFAGSRLALWAGGVITLAGGLFARHSVIRAHRQDGARVEPDE
jgi:dTMP kinase